MKERETNSENDCSAKNVFDVLGDVHPSPEYQIAMSRQIEKVFSSQQLIDGQDNLF